MRALTADWGAWMAAYEEHYDRLPDATPDARCPNCAARGLGLVFRGSLSTRTGYACFWCDACLTGIYLCRRPVPEGVPMESLHTPVQERADRVPNYALVWPTEDEF